MIAFDCVSVAQTQHTHMREHCEQANGDGVPPSLRRFSLSALRMAKSTIQTRKRAGYSFSTSSVCAK